MKPTALRAAAYPQRSAAADQQVDLPRKTMTLGHGIGWLLFITGCAIWFRVWSLDQRLQKIKRKRYVD